MDGQPISTRQIPSPKFDQATPVEYIAVRAATLSFAMKLLAEKTIVLETEYLKEEKTNEK